MSRPRVAITSTAERAAALARTVAGHDMEPVSLPCIEVISAPDDQLEIVRAAAEQADLILVTSARAIEAVWPTGGMPSIPFAAVGAFTANAVTSAGGRVAVVGDAGAGALADMLAGKVTAKSVVFPHASGACRSTIETLERLGASVTALPVYETRSIGPAADPVEVATFGSPSAVGGWCRSRSLAGLVLAVIGKATDSALVERGYRAHVVPARPVFDLMVSELASFLRERSPV